MDSLEKGLEMKFMAKFKVAYYGILLLLLTGLVEACSNEAGSEFHAGYQQGKQNFDYVESHMASVMSFWDLSLRMNAYLGTLEKGGEDKVKDFFPEYTLCRMNEHEWLGLMEQDTIFRIVTDDLDLTTETAQWEVVGYHYPYEGKISILCSDLRSWKFTVTALENREWISEANLKIDYKGEGMPWNFNDGDWIVNGVGKSIVDEESILNFEIAESLIRFADSKYLFNKGTLYLKLKSLFSQKEDVVKAEMKSFSNKERSLQITYKGEVYSY